MASTPKQTDASGDSSIFGPLTQSEIDSLRQETQQDVARLNERRAARKALTAKPAPSSVETPAAE